MPLNDESSPVSMPNRSARGRPFHRLIGRTIALGLLKGMATAAGGMIVSSTVWWFGHR